MYALGARIDDPITSDLSAPHLIEQAEKLIAECNEKEKTHVQFTTCLVWIRTAIRLAKALDELKEMEVV